MFGQNHPPDAEARLAFEVARREALPLADLSHEVLQLVWGGPTPAAARFVSNELIAQIGLNAPVNSRTAPLVKRYISTMVEAFSTLQRVGLTMLTNQATGSEALYHTPTRAGWASLRDGTAAELIRSRLARLDG